MRRELHAALFVGIAAVASGCSADVRETGEGAGGAAIGGATGQGGPVGEGGQGGAPAPAPRTILIGEGFTDSKSVFVSDPSGVIKTTLAGADLPADVVVVDGDLVSFLRVGTQRSLESYRVTPEVFALGQYFTTPIPPSCDGEPMQVSVTVPAVDGAFDYWVMTDTWGIAHSMAPGDATIDVTSCDADFDLFVYARTGGGAVVAYQLIEGLPYLPGTSVSIPITLEAPERRPVAVEVTGLEGVKNLSGFADWSAGAINTHEPGNAVNVDQPSSPFLFAPNLISPGEAYGTPVVSIGAAFEPGADGTCSGGGYLHFGETDEVLSFAPNRLALAAPAGDASWAFVTPGAAGDHVWQSWVYGDALDTVWIVYDDPAREPLPAVLPALPPEVGWPANAPSLLSIGHEDFSNTLGYAELVSGMGSLDVLTAVETRSWGPCN